MTDVVIDAAAPKQRKVSLSSQVEEAMQPFQGEALKNVAHLLKLAGVPLKDGQELSAAETARQVEAFVRKQNKTKRVVKTKTKQLRVAAAKVRAVRATGDGEAETETKNRKQTCYMVFANHVRNRVKAEHPELVFKQVGKFMGEQWKALGDEGQAVYRTYTGALNEIIEKGGKLIAWPENAADLPVEQLHQHWRDNLTMILHNKERASEWTAKSLREMLARFYGAELVESHKDAIKAMIQQLVADQQL